MEALGLDEENHVTKSHAKVCSAWLPSKENKVMHLKIKPVC